MTLLLEIPKELKDHASNGTDTGMDLKSLDDALTVVAATPVDEANGIDSDRFNDELCEAADEFSERPDACKLDGEAAGQSSTYGSSETSQVVPRRSSLKKQTGQSAAPRLLERRRSFEVNVRGKSEPVRRTRRVVFSRKVKVRPIMTYPHSLKNSLWQQPSDFKRMRVDQAKLLLKLKTQPPKGQNEICEDDDIRGLEKLLSPELQEYRLHLLISAWDAVINEQDQQESAGYYDDERISLVYRFTTRECPKKALIQGQRDYESIQAYLKCPETLELMCQSR